MTSPYLRKPLRTLAQAMAERERACRLLEAVQARNAAALDREKENNDG